MAKLKSGSSAGKYKLKACYRKIVKEGADGFGNFEAFKVWSIRNKYKPWKILCRVDDDVLYGPDNCYWDLDKRGIDLAEPIKKNRSYDNVVKNLKFVAYNSTNMSVTLGKMEEIIEELGKYRVIDTSIAKDMLKQCQIAYRSMNDICNTVEKINLDKDDDDFVRILEDGETTEENGEEDGDT